MYRGTYICIGVYGYIRECKDVYGIQTYLEK